MQLQLWKEYALLIAHMSNDEIGTVLRGEKVVRDDTGGAGTSDRRRRASVPTTTGPAPGASPEPQPGV